MGTVYLFRGKAATGKTTLSSRLAQKLAIPVFRKDDITDAIKSGEYLTDRAPEMLYVMISCAASCKPISA